MLLKSAAAQVKTTALHMRSHTVYYCFDSKEITFDLTVKWHRHHIHCGKPQFSYDNVSACLHLHTAPFVVDED